VDEGDPGLRTASSQQIRAEGRTIDVKSLGYSIGQEGLLEDDRQGANGSRGTEGIAAVGDIEN